MSDFAPLKSRSSSQKNLGRSTNSTQNISKRKPENKQGKRTTDFVVVTVKYLGDII